MVYAIKLETNVGYTHEYPNGSDDKNFFASVREKYSKATFPLQLKGNLELGNLGNDFVGVKVDRIFATFDEFMKWVNDAVWELNYDWTR